MSFLIKNKKSDIEIISSFSPNLRLSGHHLSSSPLFIMADMWTSHTVLYFREGLGSCGGNYHSCPAGWELWGGRQEVSGENHAAAGLLQETRLFQPAKVGTDKARSGGRWSKHVGVLIQYVFLFPDVSRFGTERLYAQKEDLLHEVLELEAEKGLLVSSEGSKYQVDVSVSCNREKRFPWLLWVVGLSSYSFFNS